MLNEMRLFGTLIVKINEAADKDTLTGENVLDRQNFEFFIKAIHFCYDVSELFSFKILSLLLFHTNL